MNDDTGFEVLGWEIVYSMPGHRLSRLKLLTGGGWIYSLTTFNEMGNVLTNAITFVPEEN